MILGIDPGQDGGYAFCDAGRMHEVGIFPRLGPDIDYRALTALLLGHPIDIAVIEKAQPRPHDGKKSAFANGLHNGYLRGLFVTRDIPMQLVTPQAWKKVILAGTGKDKDAAIAYVRDRHPGVNLLRTRKCTRAHDGMADAACIAEYGWRTYTNESR